MLYYYYCPSVRPSVAYIANNSRTQRPSMAKFGRKVPHLWCDSHTSFNVKRSKVKVTRPINAETHRAPYLPNGKAYELQTWWMEDNDPHQPQAPWPSRSKVKVARSRNLSEPSWPNAVPVSLEADRGIRVGRTRRPHFLLWAPAQRKRATMLYFANVLFIYLFFFMAAFYSPALVNGGSRKFYTWSWAAEQGGTGGTCTPHLFWKGVQEGTLCESLCVSRCAVNGFVPF